MDDDHVYRLALHMAVSTPTELGLDAFDRLPAARRRALLCLAICVQEAENRGDRELARELCGVVIREAKLAAGVTG